jgi:hypothetical protein
MVDTWPATRLCQTVRILDEELPRLLLRSATSADGCSTPVSGVQATVNDIVAWNGAERKVIERKRGSGFAEKPLTQKPVTSSLFTRALGVNDA